MHEVQQLLQFQETAEVIHTPAQEELWGMPRRKFLLAGPIGNHHKVPLTPFQDKFTGLNESEMRQARLKWNPCAKARAEQLKAVLLDGPKWETETSLLIAKLDQKRGKIKKFVKKRIGSRAVKQVELEE